MENNQNTYQQQIPPQMGQPVMPPMMPPHGVMPRQRGSRRSAWQQRLFGNTNAKLLALRQERKMPNWIVGALVITFFIAMVACLAWNWFKLKGRGMI